MRSVEDAAAPTDPSPRSPDDEVWVAVADLHGHPGHLEALLGFLDRDVGRSYQLMLLGDYVDNGPDIPRLLDLLIALRAKMGPRFHAILGNHDLACLRTLGWPGQSPDPAWFEHWNHYWGWRGGRGSTPDAYGAASAPELARKMPFAHVAFLRSLPWCHDTGRYLFVHGGLEMGPIEPQRRALEARELPREHTFLPPPLRDKRLATISDEAWDRVVVSGHTRNPAGRMRSHPHAPNFLTPTRICLSAEIDQAGVLYAVILPERRIVRVGHDLVVHASG